MMLVLRFFTIAILSFTLSKSAYSLSSFFGASKGNGESKQNLTASSEIFETIEKYKAEADIYFKEKNIPAVLEKYNKIYALIETYNLETERLAYYLYLTKVNHYQHDNLALLENLNSAMLIAMDLEDETKLAYIYSRIGYVHFEEKNYFLAESLVAQATDIYEKINDEKGLLEVYYNGSIIAEKLGKPIDAQALKLKYDELVTRHLDADIFKLSLNDNKSKKLDLRAQFKEKGFIEANLVEIQILNKVTARVYKYTLKLGEELTFENINIVARTCWKTPLNQLPNNYAFFSVMDNKTYENIFYGWILSSDPGLNSMTHPFYNISLRNCITKDYK